MERLKEAIHIALADLSLNVIRSGLSVLGVVIGIAAVITVLATGAGARKQILQRIGTMGMSTYNISARYDEASMRMGEFSLDDIDRLEKLPFVMSATPQLNVYRDIRAREGEVRSVVTGGDESTLESRGVLLTKGRNFSPIETESRAAVCLVNFDAARALFTKSDPVGQTIYFEGLPWEVIGVYAYSADQASWPAGMSNPELLMPLATLLRNVKDLSFHAVDVRIKPGTEDAVAELTRAMERDDPKRKGLYSVQDPNSYYKQALEIQKIMLLIGALVAAISLVVGGVGMMNVMLTSVAERTKEIGLRRAVGARKKDILFQFLVESCVLSGVGGMLGLLLGAAIARALPLLFKAMFAAPPEIKPSFLVLSVGAGVLLGMTFGFYPAIKASRLSPAEALRSE